MTKRPGATFDNGFTSKGINFMHGLKSVILSILSADWLDWPCPVNAALQNSSQDFFVFYILIIIYVFKYETIVRISAWSFGHPDPVPSSVFSLAY